MWEDNQLVVERINNLIATEATVFQAALSTAVGAFAKDGGRAAHKSFVDLIKELSGDE